MRSADILNRLREAVEPDQRLSDWFTANYSEVARLLKGLSSVTPPADIILEHSPSEGTTIRTKSRQWNDAIKALRYPRFVWSGSRNAWYVQNSANQKFPPYPLKSIAERLQTQGITVDTVVSEGEALSFAEQVEAKKERAADRSSRYSERAFKAASQSTAAWKRGHDLASAIPFGQPILVGHHSEKRARRDVERIRAATRKSIELDDKAAYYRGRSAGAEARVEQMESPAVTVRRIERLETNLRSVKRDLTGMRGHDEHGIERMIKPTGEWLDRLNARKQNLEEQIAYWKGRLQSKEARPYGPEDFSIGDRVGKYAVLRVGDKSITLAQRRTDYASKPPVAEPFAYTRMGTTKGPVPDKKDPEKSGKHPRSALIDAIYKHPMTPDVWKVRIGWKHGIVIEPGDGGTQMLILEDLPDSELDALATERGIPVAGKIEKAAKHPYAKLIAEVYKAAGSGYRKQDGGIHYLLNLHGNIALESLSPKRLAEIAWDKDIDVTKYGLPLPYTKAQRIKYFSKAFGSGGYSDLVPFEGGLLSRADANAIDDEVKNERMAAWVENASTDDIHKMAVILREIGYKIRGDAKVQAAFDAFSRS